MMCATRLDERRVRAVKQLQFACLSSCGHFLSRALLGRGSLFVKHERAWRKRRLRIWVEWMMR